MEKPWSMRPSLCQKKREYMTSYSEFLTFTNNNEMGGEEN